MIKEAYCSLEVAKLLKEKGFNELVHHEYHYIITVPQFHKKKHNFNGKEYEKCYTEWFSAPTHQMAMKWLREVHSVFISIDAHTANHWDGYIATFEIDILKNAYRIIVPNEIAIHNVYEEAVETAIKYSLENLI